MGEPLVRRVGCPGVPGPRPKLIVEIFWPMDVAMTTGICMATLTVLSPGETQHRRARYSERLFRQSESVSRADLKGTHWKTIDCFTIIHVISQTPLSAPLVVCIHH